MDYFIIDYNVEGQNTLALEDSIMQKGRPITAGSKMLDNFIAPINATVVDKLSNEYKIAGKTVMDEFGIPSFFSGESDEISGAIKAVVDNAVSFSLCNDVFGKYRKQAADNKLCYIHPTYGTVSRYGLVPVASSMDQIGIVCKDMREGFKLLSLIAGNDEKDGAMFSEKSYSYDNNEQDLTLAIPDSVIRMADKNVQDAIGDFAKNFKTTSLDLEHFNVYKQVMYILSCAEISNNISRYDGVNFGYRTSNYTNIDELYTNSRTEGFGYHAKLTAIMGTMVLTENNYKSYYDKAMKLRRLIKDGVSFEGYDIIVLPCDIGKDPYDNLSLYSLANLAGLPSVSFSYKGQGIQLIANVRKESSLLTAWEVCMK